MHRISRSFLLAVLLFHAGVVLAQSHHSVHRAHKEHYDSLGLDRKAEWDSLHGIEDLPQGSRSSRSCSLQHVVYGWHPYWMGSSYSNYRWDLLSHFSYFSFEVDPNTGYPSTTHNWSSSSAVTAAQNNGVKADLCVTLFSDHATFLNSSTARQNLIDTLISLVQARNANGVNIDFENIPGSEGTAYNNFLVDLATQMHSQIPGSEVSVALFSVDWNNIFDIPLLDQHLDHFVIMGYGYYYSGSSEAGPTAPLYDFGSSTWNLSRSINQYLKEGASPSKLVLGLPYYGYQWETASDQIPENTTNTGSSKTYTDIRDNVNGYYSNTNRGWHFDSRSNYFVFQDNGNWLQCFVDMERGLDERYDMIHRRDLAGMGIWALGYDDGYSELWNEIEKNFTDCRSVPCTDTIYDMGGPDAPYYHDEHYAFSIDPDGSGRVELAFQNFDIEAGYDSLWLYDGSDTNAPLLGGYSGTSGPGTVLSSGEAITLEFASDGATSAPGWEAIWTCISDTSKPGTDIEAVPEWVTAPFQIAYSDTDGSNGSGVRTPYYRVIQKDSNRYRGNERAGFFRDAFEGSSLHPDWTVDTGSWQVSNGMLYQDDQSISNTNIHAPLRQDLSESYLFHWKAKMNGSGNNRRAGLHYFCDSLELSERGNSYFVWFRLDDDRIQLYKAVNNSWGSGPVHEVPYPFQEGQWYDLKLSFDRISGSTRVYVNGNLEAEWIDPNPHPSGKGISFRTGNAELKVEEFSAYRSRGATTQVKVGPSPENPIRYQNDGPSEWGARIDALAQDSAGNLGPIVRDSVKVDTTAPLIDSVRDGNAVQDQDTVLDPNGTLTADWNSAEDPHSGIDEYASAIGNEAGDSSVAAWISGITDTTVSRTGLNLEADSTYYFTIEALNGAGLSERSISDGILILKSSSLREKGAKKAKIHPTPFQDRFTLRWATSPSFRKVRLYDARGRRVPIRTERKGAKKLSIRLQNARSKGMHFLWVEKPRQRDRVYQVIRR